MDVLNPLLLCNYAPETVKSGGYRNQKKWTCLTCFGREEENWTFLAFQSRHVKPRCKSYCLVLDNNDLPSCCGQSANINAHGEFGAKELEAHGIAGMGEN
jgi:hypothetical protein